MVITQAIILVILLLLLILVPLPALLVFVPVFVVALYQEPATLQEVLLKKLLKKLLQAAILEDELTIHHVFLVLFHF